MDRLCEHMIPARECHVLGCRGAIAGNVAYAELEDAIEARDVSLADLSGPPEGLDYARPGDRLLIEDGGEIVGIREVVSAWTRTSSRPV